MHDIRLGLVIEIQGSVLLLSSDIRRQAINWSNADAIASLLTNSSASFNCQAARPLAN